MAVPDSGSSAAASSSSSGQPLQQKRLQQAAATIKKFSEQDRQVVDLADYLNASVNQPYKLYLSSPWASLRKVQTLTIPDAVIQASTSARSFAAQGLFPEIERAWIIIDSQLFLWNYLEGSSSAFESYVHPTDIIQSVSLVAPKAGVFIDSIKHLLVISTQQSVTILGLAIETTPPPNAQRELRLYQTDFSLPTSGVVMRDFVATSDGSRLFCRGSDACLYELYYQAKEGWFSSKCSLKNLTSGGVRNLLPGWAGGATKGSLESIVVDHSRALFYVLESRRTISSYSIPSALNGGVPQLVTTLRDIHRTASLISPQNASLLRQEDFAIISLQPIRAEESRTICLLATTSNGVRLYFTNQRSGYRAFTAPSTSLGGSSTLELLYVRPPPASGLSPTPLPPTGSNSGSADQSDYPQAQPPLQRLSHAIYKDGHFLAAAAYPYGNGLDNVLCISRGSSSATILNNTTVSAGQNGESATTSTSVIPSSGPASASTPADPAEQATNVLIQGATWALAEVPRPNVGPASLNPLVRQMTSLPRTFLALTSTGLTVLVENRPMDLLRELLDRASAASGQGNAETVGLVEVFKRFGQAQSCAMALAIATRNSHASFSLEALLSVSRPSASAFSAQMHTAESLLNATRIYFDYGGLPRYDPPPYPHQPMSEGRVVLSGRHEGLGVYATRLLQSLWEKKIKEVGRVVGTQSADAIVGKDMEELRSFVRTHAEAYGLNNKRGGSNAPGGGGEGELLAQKTEQESLRALNALLERSIEALSFVILLGDFGWERVLSKVGDVVRAKVDSMSFGDLVLEVSSAEQSGSAGGPPGSASSGQGQQAISRSLVEAIIDLHSVSSPSGMDVIADLLQSRCSSFCDANDVRLYKALEHIRQAKESAPGLKRDEALRESEMLMMKASRRLPFERLQEVVGLWNSMSWVSAAIQLPLRCAQEWDPHGFARAYRADGMRASDDTRKAAYDVAMKCYGLVLDTLKSLDEKADATPQAVGVETLRSTAYGIVQQSMDPLLHEALYDFLLRSGRREQLLGMTTPFLEAYLQQEPLTLEKLEMLWQCYTRRGEGASAARVLVGLAESTELDLTLFQRVEYLTLASNNAKSSTLGGGLSDLNHATVAFVAEIEEKLEVAQVQVEVYRAISELDDLEEDKKAGLLDDLDSSLHDISTLYRDFADPLGLHDVKILIFQVSDFRDVELVAETWELILDRAHQEGGRLLSPDRAYERVAAVVIELGRRHMNSDFACPIDVLVRNLEHYAFTQRSSQPIPIGWAPQTLLAASASPEAIFDVLEGLFQSKVEPWQTKSSIVFLLSDLYQLISIWLGSHLNSSGYDTLPSSNRRSIALSRSSSSFGGLDVMESFPAKRVDDSLDAYLSTLNSLLGQLREVEDGQLARESINGMKVLQDRLRQAF
ncbi:nucleoporin-domain-containing protein [Microstroma glucosiphilum]|uniref:Nucleoporin-domain-containing protein n=1 Tax=Pseudomicrostroma glucosiphilum TaxID=1684307 RepID=A0A316UAN8_9BASI|nr:nucleoporin-domain-containing protein [Pseudomicrostroma glucosiphilum]PWN22229.1 nucleoporin-domain-containing protein [Pseudomicrostroma glucosiphilum]